MSPVVEDEVSLDEDVVEVSAEEEVVEASTVAALVVVVTVVVVVEASTVVESDDESVSKAFLIFSIFTGYQGFSLTLLRGWT